MYFENDSFEGAVLINTYAYYDGCSLKLQLIGVTADRNKGFLVYVLLIIT